MDGSHPSPPTWSASAPPPRQQRRRRRTAVVVGALALVTAALVSTALVVRGRSAEPDRATDFGPGPRVQPTKAWVVAIEPGFAELVMSDGDRAYLVPTIEDEEHEVTVTAYAADDGEELWSRSVAPLFDGPTLVLLGDDQVLLADADDRHPATSLLDADTGERVWRTEGRPSSAYAPLGIRPAPRASATGPVYLLARSDQRDRVVAVDRASGEELWRVRGWDALSCDDDTVVTYFLPDETDRSADGPWDVAVREAGTGDELWSTVAVPSRCADGRIALATATDEVTVFEAHRGAERAVLTLRDLSEDDLLMGTAAFGDHVAVSRIDDEGGNVHAAVFPADGGAATWEGADRFVVPIGRDFVLTGEGPGSHATVVRARDGGVRRRVPLSDLGDRCGAISFRTLVVCESGGLAVTSYALEGDLPELWTVDVGFDVEAVAVGGDTLFALGEDELVALR